ncbi:putative ABC transport system substrate-binding protein [Duganella sacchari]|uniref:Putative ABC transport system substrate-binding protein n=1 Tax=Duganella sacchari TaxID=551987 RepID=A0A1M7L7H4_9BURK|nr:ABC transporter substrate binding protein [Duganella sacchari]SHM73826.1 putative ABC transport system substrate-binding protein [Duganella sacchari]
MPLNHRFLVCASTLLLLSSNAAAQSLTVLYPEIGEPYRAVFAEIIQGIEEQSKARAHTVPLAANSDAAELRGNAARVVIALGRQGLRAASALEPAPAIVVGGIGGSTDAERYTGISLTPDPALLFATLKGLLPGVRRVIVVYNPQTNAALIRIAQDAARTQGLELTALEAANLASAARIYETQLASADGCRDALWLPQDAVTVDENTILPLVLKESWTRSLPVFSSSVLHVKKGVLFGMYPNNQQLGRDLAALALSMQNGETVRREVTPLRAVRTALNTRTASHLGLNLVVSQQRNFDAIYPQP